MKGWQEQHQPAWAQRNASSDDSGGGATTLDHAHVHTAWGAEGSSAQPGETGKRGAAFPLLPPQKSIPGLDLGLQDLSLIRRKFSITSLGG